MLVSIKTACDHCVSWLDRFSWVGPFVVRLTLGLVFVVAGWGKLHSLDQVTEFFDSLHIPAPYLNAVFVSSVELVGGAMLLAGFGTRIAAMFLVVVMAVAIWTAKRPDLHGVVDLATTIEFTYLAAFMWLMVAGAGRASLDYAVARRCCGPTHDRCSRT